ncbi:MAG: PqqD family protein [Kiritimatiellae bacterium]|nr:PqqD family protein [Kiritimatiellia bacterium]
MDPACPSTGQEIRWMGLRMQVPLDWEIRRHGISPDIGSLVFVDHRTQRMEVRWQRPDKEPDLNRTLEHAMDAVRKAHPDVHISPRLPSRTGAWTGFVYDRESRVYRAVLYEKDTNVLLQTTLTLDGSREETHEFVRNLLNHLTLTEAPEKATHWRAFGIDCRVPADWVLREAVAKPMDIRLKFDCGTKRMLSKQRTTAEVRRLGMVKDWFDGDLHGFAKSRALGNHPHVLTDNTGGRDVLRVESDVGRFFFLGPLGPKDHQQLRLWHDPDINSILVLSLTNPRIARVSMEDIQVESSVDAFLSPAVLEAPRSENQPRSPQDALLDAIPVRNEAVTLEREAEGAILRAPLRQRWWMRPPFGWFFPFRDTRGFGVDAYGMEVWEACDGTRSVKGICERFAKAHAISFGEARVAVYQFLQTLTKRELIVIQVTQDPREIA